MQGAGRALRNAVANLGYILELYLPEDFLLGFSQAARQSSIPLRPPAHRLERYDRALQEILLSDEIYTVDSLGHVLAVELPQPFPGLFHYPFETDGKNLFVVGRGRFPVEDPELLL